VAQYTYDYQIVLKLEKVDTAYFLCIHSFQKKPYDLIVLNKARKMAYADK